MYINMYGHLTAVVTYHQQSTRCSIHSAFQYLSLATIATSRVNPATNVQPFYCSILTTAEENARKQEKTLCFYVTVLRKQHIADHQSKCVRGNPLCFILTTHIFLRCGLNVLSYIQFCPVPLNLWRTEMNMCNCIWKLKLLAESDFWVKIPTVFELRLEADPSAVKLQVKLGGQWECSKISVTVLSLRSFLSRQIPLEWHIHPSVF